LPDQPQASRPHTYRRSTCENPEAVHMYRSGRC
jgi:hypothetical protein